MDDTGGCVRVCGWTCECAHVCMRVRCMRVWCIRGCGGACARRTVVEEAAQVVAVDVQAVEVDGLGG